MEIIRLPMVMQDRSREYLFHGKSLGFVPTMGALHEGHLSLVRRARRENDVTTVSIYVNPAQFGPSEDFLAYPRRVEEDTMKLRSEGVDVLFLPEDDLMYPAGFCTHVEVEGLSEKLCGGFRPGHFRGVATVVAKLLNIVAPARVYLGQKDHQQTVVIRRFVKDLNMATEVVVCPTVREDEGLAMSSRNSYLSAEERRAAAIIYGALVEGAETVKSGIIEARKISEIMQDRLRREPLVSEIQYCSVYDPETLADIERVDREVVLAIAVKIGKTRLIDNMLVTMGGVNTGQRD